MGLRTMLNRKHKSIFCKLYFVCLIIFLTLYSLNAFSQEALILTTNGDKINGTIENTEITVKTETGIIKIPLKDVALIDFVSNAKQVSAKAYLHLLRGRQFLKDGDNDSALAEFRTAVSASPDYIDANFELANLLEKMGRKSEANEYMSRVAAVDPMRHGVEEHLKEMGDWYLKNIQRIKMRSLPSTKLVFYTHGN
jgi:tetratricopeptide (TPR) repeat protein